MISSLSSSFSVSATALPAAATPARAGSQAADASASAGNADADQAKPAAAGQQALTEEQQREVTTLQKRDREVRTHEMAHVAAGGDLVTGGPNYEYQAGPDGKRYAVSGEVQIDTSPADTPEKTLDKAQRIRAAALAPAEPSTQDRQVAAMANQLIMQAQREIAMRAPGDDTTTNDAQAGTSPDDPVPANASARAQAGYAAASSSFSGIDTRGRDINVFA